MIRNALSFELEDWFHAELASPWVIGTPPSRLAWAVEPILVLLQRYRVRATFFVVGEVLRHHPELVRRIYDQGHEIGCHGWSHRPLWALDPQRLARELQAFDRDAAGVVPPERVIGFRAPAFSLDQRTHWAIDVLRDHGLRYDSSIFPVRTCFYGLEGAPPRPYRPTSKELTLDHEGSEFLEFPLTTYPLAGFHLPISGGFYLRAMPLAMLRYGFSQVNARGDPFVLNLHSWETEAKMPLPKGVPWSSRWIIQHRTTSTLCKLEALLKGFRFAPLREVLALHGGRAVTVDVT